MSSEKYVLIASARNEEAYIKKTIQSVTSQTILPKAWIIVSDGSTDCTDDIVSRYAKKHDFIQLVHLDNNGTIDMQYHFDESMNTHVIESINGLEGWWHFPYYDGGWPEVSVFRMDHYPYKDKMTIRLHQKSISTLEGYYEVFLLSAL